jgi:hypothetical protein
MISGEHNQNIREADLAIEVAEELGQLAICSECHVLDLLTVWSISVTQEVIGRETYW